MPRKRSSVTQVACDTCRKRKVKCDGARPTCNRCESRGSSAPCQYEKLHHVKSLREEISELQAELSEAKGGLPPVSDSASAPRLLRRESHEAAAWQLESRSVPLRGHLPPNDLQSKDNPYEEPHGSTTTPELQTYPSITDSSSAISSNARSVPYGNDVRHGYLTQSSAPPDNWESSHNIHPPSGGFDPSRASSIARSDDDHDMDEDPEPRHPEATTGSGSIVDVFGDNSLSGAIKCNRYPSVLQDVQLSNMKLPAHLSSSLWLGAEKVSGKDVGWVNNTFWEMRSRGRWLAQQGLEATAIMGDTCPMIAPFALIPSGEVDVKFWTVSRWAARFVDNFPQIAHSDRLACWIVIFVIFQWQICQNAETYRTIPDWYRPLPFQSFVPHMACLDILIWPSARLYLSKHPQDFIQAVMNGISVSWPHGDSMLYSTDLLTGKRTISQTFVAWCLDMDNWTVTELSLASTPQLVGKIKTR